MKRYITIAALCLSVFSVSACNATDMPDTEGGKTESMEQSAKEYVLINSTQPWGGWCTNELYVDRPHWGRCLVPLCAFWRTTNGIYTHELTGHGLGLFSDEYVWNNYDEKVFPDDKMGTEFYLKMNYHGLGLPVEGAVYYGRGVWRATNHSAMRSSASDLYFNPVQRAELLRQFYILAGKESEYSFEKFLDYDKRNVELDMLWINK